MNIFKQFLNYRKGLKKVKEIKKIIDSNTELGNETRLLVNNIKVNIEHLVTKFPELGNVYADCLEVLKKND